MRIVTQRVWRATLTVVFLALLATPLFIRQVPNGDSGRPHPADALDRYGFHLVEIAHAAGIDFVHRGPTFDDQLSHIMPEVASLGAAVSVADFDGDGWQDFYVTNSEEDSLNRLYHNQADGTFREVADEMGVADVNQTGTGVSMGAVWGDYDNDGYEDLFVYKYGRPELFHNERGTSFQLISDRADFPAWVNANAAVWLDYDRDGWLDLFLAGYYAESVNLWDLATTRMMPDSFEYAENGGRNYLFRNRRDGRFEEVGGRLGINGRRWTLAVAAADLSGNGYPDLFLSNDYGVSELYANEDGERFVEVGKQVGIGAAPKSGMNVAFGDVLNNGRLAIYETNISEPGVLMQANNLWVPETGMPGDMPEFRNLASSVGVDLGGWSWGAQFGDLNSDGTLDIYLVNGFVSGSVRTSYWYDFSQIAVGHGAIIEDAKNWPPMNGRSLSGYQQKKIWINDGRGRFTEVAQVVGATDTYDGRAVALADLSNRGVLDVIVANQRGPLLLYKNTVQPGRHWVTFNLVATVSNRSAIGARVEVFWNGQQQVQEVSGGSGFSAQNQRPLHFGLGSVPTIDRVTVRWPSGAMQTIERPEPDRVHMVTEPS